MWNAGPHRAAVLPTWEVSEGISHRRHNQSGGRKSEETRRLKDLA